MLDDKRQPGDTAGRIDPDSAVLAYVGRQRGGGTGEPGTVGSRTDLRVPDRTGYDRDLSEDILLVILKEVSAEQQEGYVRQLEAFADREHLKKLYSRYGPDGRFEDRDLCYLTHQPKSVVVCERLDTVPMGLAGVWNGPTRKAERQSARPEGRQRTSRRLR
ncbi:hypothetical protein [Streptomyces chiangmaiensis]|uniref:Uncharacterized protein n=1 Tax=Streptomyces chiangmaiensis TaxID=766497 RepID=A0ABU7FUS8_9ACTN|nr:hypothetical protein [Streptomyces chiangmaiensis]MED7827573.1 hypothetical protein [Streptomyces chiangmaiensis]